MSEKEIGWLEPYRTSAVPDPMMRPVPTAPPREIMEIWGDGEQAPILQEKGETGLSGIEASVEGLIALWIDQGLISNDAGGAGGSLLDIGRLLV